MKMTKSVRIAALSLVAFAIPLTGSCQTYTLSTPISGYLTMNARDLNGPAGSSGGSTYNFSTLTETIYVNPVAQTIEQWGTISGTPSAQSISFQEIQTVTNGIFPNPTTILSLTGNVTVALAPAGGALSFDTGPKPLMAASGGYTFDAQIMPLGPFNGSYTLVTGGQTYSKDFTYSLLAIEGACAHTFDMVSTVGYPNTLTLSGVGYVVGDRGWYADYNDYREVVADIIATNGFNMELAAGTVPDGVEHLFWSAPGTVTATEVVPEPTSFSLLAFAIFGIMFLRRRSS